MTLQYLKPTPIKLKGHTQFTEKWLQDRICEDPSILRLGDLEVKDVERVQPRAGRLDLLLRDPDTGKRYEVEMMLGTVDESHIIRTIEYWDIERKRYPQYDHCAVIVAENITSRFLNVISLFNTVVPIVALQLDAVQVGDNIILNFVKVLDEIILGEDDEDDGTDQVTDRSYWELKGSKLSLMIADECLAILQRISPGLDLNYTKFYIGITENGRTNNFVIFRPKKQFLKIEAKISDQETWKTRIEETGLVLLEGTSKRKRLIFRATQQDPKEHQELFEELFRACREERGE